MTSRDKRPMTLRSYLSLLIMVCITPFVFLVIYQGMVHMDTLEKQKILQAKNLAENAMESIDHHMEAQISVLKMLAVSPVMDDPSRWAELYDIAKSFREGFGGHIIIADTDSQMLFNSRSPLGASLPKLPKPKGHAAAPEVLATRKPSVGDSFIGPIANERLVTAIAPVLRNESVKYLLLATIEATQFQKILDAIALPQGWMLSLEDSSGEKFALRGVQVKDSLSVEAPSNLSHWKLMIDVPKADIAADSLNEAILLVLVVALAAGFGYTFGILYGKKLHHSVRAVSIKSEDTGSDIDIAELAAVQDELRDIAAKGEHAQEALKEREIMYRLLMDQASDALIVHDARGRILEVNQQTCRSLGYAKDELMSQTMVSVEVGLDPAAANARWTSIQPQVPFAHLGALRRKDGTSFRVELSYGCALWKGEKIFLVLARDVTERLEYAENLEKMVEERTAQLQEANEGLEAFSYSVSHDLKAPLRAINGFIAILEADYKENIHPEAKRYCTAISRNAHSMGVLIDEILDFSRISRQTVHKVEVDMEAMAKSVVHVLTDAAAKTQVSVEIETLFPCRGDEAMLRQAWTNLLSNALKYSAKAEAPKIHIRSRKEEGAIVYSVQDNGVGFDMAYREKLFVAFQRLHPATEFEGTGIGLAIVRQIALKHGGSVDASGEEGKGAVFTFSIPQD